MWQFWERKVKLKNGENEIIVRSFDSSATRSRKQSCRSGIVASTQTYSRNE